jgi:excinuclease ABC subunit B
VVWRDLQELTVFPGSHFVTSRDRLQTALPRSRRSCGSGWTISCEAQRLVEYQRLEQRTLFDLEMIEELGYCNGIENYSRHLTGSRRGAAAQPAGLFPPMISFCSSMRAISPSADQGHVQR